MKNTVKTYLKHLRKDRARHRRLAAVLVCLSVVVAGGTTWALHTNGESRTGETYCGYSEEHQHTEDCIGEKVLICGYDTESPAEPEILSDLSEQISEPFPVVHTHSDACYETQTVLTCTETEHTHSVENGCYATEQTLACNISEHTHSVENGCYDGDGNLICTIPEHTHSVENGCYTTGQVLVCQIPEHTHSEENGCYTTETVLICGLEEGSSEATEAGTETETEASDGDETAAHVHTDECYEITYICGFDYEHTHTLSCYSNPEADLETADDWEKTISNVELTGDFAADLVAIAKTQLGYEESTDNYQVVLDDEGNETTETKGYTRYGAWYGDAYGDWCAMFVSFCLNYADITSEMVPYAASCPSWVESLSQLGFYEPVYVKALDEDGNTITVRSDYTPEQGDLIFFDWDGNGSADHVGIVEELETGEITGGDGTASYTYIIHTIEGNSANQVAERKYDMEDETILGYGSIYTAYLTAVDTGKLEGIRHLTAETEDGASFSAIGEIPENAVLTVSPLTEEQNTYLQENFGLTGSFYDIKIIQEDGTEYQPEKAVQISVSGLGYDAHYTLTGYHLTDVSADTLMDVAAEDVTVEEVDVNNTGNRIGFGADGFSIYGVGTYSASTYADAYTYSYTIVDSASPSSDTEIGYSYNTSSSGGGGNATTTYTYAYTKTLNLLVGDTVYIDGTNSTNITSYISQSTGSNTDSNVATVSFASNAFTVEALSAGSTTYTISRSRNGTGQNNRNTYTYTVTLTINVTKPLGTSDFTDYSLTENVTLAIGSTKTYYIDSELTAIFESATISTSDESIATAQLVADAGTITVTAVDAGDATITITGTGSNSNVYTMTINVTVNEKYDLPSYWTTKRYQHLDPKVDTGFNLLMLDSNGNIVSQKNITGTASNVSATIYNTAPYYYKAAGYDEDSSEVAAVTWSLTEGSSLNNTTGNGSTIYVTSGELADLGTFLCYSPTFTKSSTQANGDEYMSDQRRMEFYDGDTVVFTFDLTYELDDKSITTTYTYTYVLGESVQTPGTNATTILNETVLAGIHNLCDQKYNTTDATQIGYDPYVELDDVIELAATSVYKYDQYGNPVEDATFTFYASDSTYTDKNYVTTATTDANGMITFYSETSDGLQYPMLMSEFREMFLNGAEDNGQTIYIIMEETDVPDGYRRTSTIAAHLYITGDGLDAVMLCNNPYESGVWCSPNANVMATQTLYLANSSDASKISGSVNDDGTITYYTSTNNGAITTKGTLFAVVMKKNSAGDTDYDNWYAVSGNDIDGYQVADTAGLAGALKYGDLYEFTVNDSGTNVAVIITDLPGDPTKYYTYMDNNSTVTSEVEYLVAYYWTPGDLSSATVDNTVRIASHDSTTGTVTTSGGFQIQWSTTLEVSNFVNALYFQKADSTGDLLDDAMFALYNAVADDSGTGYYVADGNSAYIILDSNGNGTATVYDTSFTLTATGTYKIDITGSWANGYVTDAGTITVTATDGAQYTIAPATNAAAGGGVSLVGYTHDTCNTVSEGGTGHFQYLKKGNYFLKEIAAPAGYGLNYTNIPVEVTEEAVYANAGDTTNGVRVGNGVGYVARTLDVFASLNEIDETLSWVFTHLKIEQTTYDFLDNADDTFYTYGDNASSIGFDGVGKPDGGSTGYIPQGALTTGSDLISVGTGTTLPVSGAMVQYLRYAGDLTDGVDDNKVFDYELYGRSEGVNSYRLWTESGWADLAIFQDATYADEVSTNNTNYDYLGTEEISYLFSSSTFVQVVDDVDVDLTVGKVTDDFYADATTDNTTTVYLDGAEFTLTRYVDANENIVARDEAVDDTGAVKAGYTLQYYDPDTESWGATEATLTSTTTFTGSDGTKYTVTTQVYAYDEGTQHHLIYTKVYTINGQTYRLESITDGTATLQPVTVTTDSTTGRTTTTDTGGAALTGTLARSYFKIRSLSPGTYYLTETKVPTYTDTNDKSEEFLSVEETVITISDGKYYYYVKDDNKIIVDESAVQTNSDGEKYVEVTENGETKEITVYEGNNFSISIDGDDASYLVELDGSGTTAAYYEESSGAFQVGFRVNNAVYQSVGADIQLVKVDGTANTSMTLPGSTGYTSDNQHFAVSSEDKDGDGVNDYVSDDPNVDNNGVKVTAVYNVLTGAEFKLYRISVDEDTGTETKLYYVLNENGTADVIGDEAEATVLSVDENGYLKITGLKYTYTYYLVETKAPDGYNLLDHPIKIYWSYAALKIEGESAMLQDAILMPLWDDQVYIVISNESGVELPHTGGAGTLMFTLGGIAILAVVTLVYGCGLRRRRERRAE